MNNNNDGENNSFSSSRQKKSWRLRPRKKKRKNNESFFRRFSLRRLFCGNIPEPFFTRTDKSLNVNTTTTTNMGATDIEDREKALFWRKSLNSNLQGATLASISNHSHRECLLCLSQVPVTHFPLLRNCPHLFCLECLQIYVKIEIQEGRPNVTCPQCTEILHPNDIENLLGNKNINLLQLYESLMLRRLLSTDVDVRWCPAPNCTYAVIASGCASCPRLTCERPGCNSSFCYHCKSEWHPNQTCDIARASRYLLAPASSSSTFSQESSNSSEIKVCPRCKVFIVKMDDGSCNHMTCSVCGSEFCWLCMREISDLHYLSPSGCTFWGKKPWTTKKKLLFQIGSLIFAPIGIGLLAAISLPALVFGIPIWTGRKLYEHYKKENKSKRNVAIAAGVFGSIIVSPIVACLTVSIGAPIMLAYIYGVVPISLIRSSLCVGSTHEQKMEEESGPYKPIAIHSNVANPSIGDVSLGASLSLGSVSHLERECDRESASNTAMAGTSLTGSIASSYFPGCHQRLEVGADVHPRKKFYISTERLFESSTEKISSDECRDLKNSDGESIDHNKILEENDELTFLQNSSRQSSISPSLFGTLMSNDDQCQVKLVGNKHRENVTVVNIGDYHETEYDQ